MVLTELYRMHIAVNRIYLLQYAIQVTVTEYKNVPDKAISNRYY